MKRRNESSQTSNNNNNEHWRNEKHAKMLATGIGADVFFLVGREGEEKQLISAHKYMLSAVSEVFQGQFTRFNAITGTQEGSTEERPIEITDIRPDVFRAMLGFIYSNDLGGVTKQNVLDVYCAAEKYMVDVLVSECRQLLMNCPEYLGVDNMFSALKHAQRHEDKELLEHCWTFVDEKFESLPSSGIKIESKEFHELDQADLCELFSRDTLEGSEVIHLFKLDSWAEHQCELEGRKATSNNRQKCVGKAIYQIRLPLISLERFTKYVVPTDLLSKDDMLALFLHFGNCDDDQVKKKFPNRFNSQPRTSES